MTPPELVAARGPAGGCGVAAEEEFEAVLAATADTSFSFVDALSIAAWAPQSRLTMVGTETRWISMTAGSGVPRAAADDLHFEGSARLYASQDQAGATG